MLEKIGGLKSSSFEKKENTYTEMISSNFGQSQSTLSQEMQQMFAAWWTYFILFLLSNFPPFLAIAKKDENNKGSKPSLNIPSSALTDPYVVEYIQV